MEKRWDGAVEEDYLQDYKPVSVLGIFSFILGLIGAFCLYVPEVWPVGVLSVLLSFVTIFRTRNQPASLSWLAYIAAFVSVLTVTWSQAAHSSYESNLLGTASKHGQAWLQMIADGKVNEAICLRMPYQDRPLEGTDLDEFFKLDERPDKTMSMMPGPSRVKEIFVESETVKELVSKGNEVKIQPKPEKDVITSTGQGVAEVSTYYDLEYVERGRPVKEEVVVLMYRLKLASGVQWQVKKILNNSNFSTLGAPKMMTEGAKK